MLDHWLENKLREREQKQLLRSLTTSDGLVDFSSNDYLGLARNEELFNQIHETLLSRRLLKNGATGSRLLSGNSSYAQEVEDFLATIFNAPSTLICNSGYTANVAVLSALPQRGDTILYDELAHASLKDGARLSLASRFSFHHNDLHDLEKKLKKATGNIFIVAESVYSMDGDQCPLAELVEIAERYDASLILDEAHSTGVLGKDGCGLSVSLGLEKRIAVRVYTFGKAMGVHGACVAGSTSLTKFLVNFARPFIYTTALSPHSFASIQCAFVFLQHHPALQTMLHQKIALFHHGAQHMSNRTDSNSAIQTAIFPGNENARHAAAHLQQCGFDVRPILSPTVAVGAERLRICLHAYNTDQDIQELCSQLRQLSENTR